MLAAAGMTALLATYWDDAWHTDIGRDSAVIPPHLLLYGAVAAAGLVVVGWGARVLVRTRSLMGTLRQPGLGLAGAGGAVTLGAAPIDAAWHTAFGRDSVLWSPPHMLVVFASAAMVAGVLIGLAPTRRGLVESALAGLLLGGLAVSVMEYDTDVPQFPQVFYLPVLLVAVLPAAAAARRFLPRRAPVTTMVLAYVSLRVVAMVVLALLGRSTPDLPVAIVGLCVVDLPWRASGLRYAGGAAGIAALAWVGAITGLTRQSPPALATVAAPVLVAFVLLLLASARRARPVALTALGVLGAAGLLLGTAPPAFAHDPDQGAPLGSAQVSVTSDGHGGLDFTVRPTGGCDQIEPSQLVARRAGRVITAPLTTAGMCRYAGTVRVPADGRWFVYAELRRAGQGAETWLPVQAGQPTSHTETRQLYLPAQTRPATRGIEIGAGAAIYAIGLGLLGCALLAARRARTSTTSPGQA